MPHLCVNSPIPSLDGILASFSPYLTFPPKFPSIHLPTIHIPDFPGIPDLHFPSLPGIPDIPSLLLNFLGLPNPLFGSLRMPNIELSTIALHLQSFQLQNTLMNMIKPIIGFLGLALDSIIPKIPGLPDFSLIDLISGDISKVVQALRNAITNKIHFPDIPSPLFGSLLAKAVELPHTLMMLTANYLQKVVMVVIDLIKKVTDKLKIPGMPSLPSFPSFDSLVTSLKNAIAAKIASIHLPSLHIHIPDFDLSKLHFPDLPNILGMLKLPSLDLSGLLSSLTFPGFPALPKLPDPLIPAFNVPDINITLSLMAMVNHFTNSVMKPIMDFITNTLSKFIGFNFPVICIDF